MGASGRGADDGSGHHVVDHGILFSELFASALRRSRQLHGRPPTGSKEARRCREYRGGSFSGLGHSFGRLQDLANRQYLMKDITRLPYITKMDLKIIPNGHSFAASVFHMLRMCTGVRKLELDVDDATSCPEAQTACPSGCICNQPPNWKTEELALNCLQEVEIYGLRGTEHEAALVKRLFEWAPMLEKMTVMFCAVNISTAKKLKQMLQSFSRPGIHMIWRLRVAE